MASSQFTHIGDYADEAVLIQEVIYYCDSRFRVALRALQSMHDYPDAQRIMQGRIEQELVSYPASLCPYIT